MKPYHWIGTAFLCAVLLFCAACSPAAEITPAPVPEPALTPTPAPAPEPTPVSSPLEAEPGQFIFDNLNAAFSDGKLDVRVFLNNGSGPASTAVLDSECGQELRDLLSAYDWKAAQQPQVESVPFDSFAVELYDDDAPCYIWFYTYSDVLCLSSAGDVADRLYFSADGAKNLSRNIAALCPNPIVQCALVSCAAEKTGEAAARQFMDDLFAVMLGNGHITDYEISGLRLLDASDTLTFDVRFRVRAARPERDIWTNGYSGYSVDESGWTNAVKWQVCLATDEKGEIYRLDWIS